MIKLKQIINKIKQEIDSLILSPQSISDFINKIEELQRESSPIVQIICSDDYQILKLARLLIIKINTDASKNHISITGDDWRKEGVDFSLIKFWMDDLEINRIIAYKFIALGGNAGFEVVRRRDFLKFIYDEVNNVINNLRLNQESIIQPKELITTDVTSQIQQRRETEIHNTLLSFKQFVERDGWRALWTDGSIKTENIKNCPEEIGKSQLMAFLKGYSITFEIRHNTFQEVPEGAGFCDVIHIDHFGRKFVFELKIWRGQQYFDTGIKELDSYLYHEGLNEGFYILFDTRIREKNSIITPIRTKNNKTIHVVQIDIAQIPPTRNNS